MPTPDVLQQILYAKDNQSKRIIIRRSVVPLIGLATLRRGLGFKTLLPNQKRSKVCWATRKRERGNTSNPDLAKSGRHFLPGRRGAGNCTTFATHEGFLVSRDTCSIKFKPKARTTGSEMISGYGLSPPSLRKQWHDDVRTMGRWIA